MREDAEPGDDVRSFGTSASERWEEKKRKRITCLFPNPNPGPFWELCESQPDRYFRPRKEVMSGKKRTSAHPRVTPELICYWLKQEVSLGVQKKTWFPLSRTDPGLCSDPLRPRQVAPRRRAVWDPVGFIAHGKITEQTQELQEHCGRVERDTVWCEFLL